MGSKWGKYVPPAPSNVVELHPEPRQVNIVLALNVPARKQEAAAPLLDVAAAAAAAAMLQSGVWAQLRALGVTWEGEGVDYD